MRMTFETMRAEDLPGAQIYEQQKKIKEGMQVALGPVLRRMRMEERGFGEGGAGDEGSSSLRSSTDSGIVMPEAGDEINSILNAAYSDPNSSLVPKAPPGGPPPSPKPTLAPRKSAAPAPAPAKAPPPPAPARPAPASSSPKPRGSNGSLLSSFRGD